MGSTLRFFDRLLFKLPLPETDVEVELIFDKLIGELLLDDELLLIELASSAIGMHFFKHTIQLADGK